MKLKMFAADFFHCSPVIAGDDEALLELAEQIRSAVIRKRSRTKTLFESDGEGFSVMVVRTDGDEFDSLPVHYTDDCAEEKDPEKWKNLNRLLLDDNPEGH